jgi:hypothetical protein
MTIWATHLFAVRQLNVRDENGHEGCAHCGRPRTAHRDQVMTASTAGGTLTVRQCTCSFAWGMDELGRMTEVRRPGLACPTHPLAALRP